MDENRNETMQQPVSEAAEQPVAAVPQPTAPVGNPTATTALVLSIIAAALCEWPFVNIAAIVLAALALPRANKAVACANAGGGKKPMAIIAKVLSIVSLVAAIVATVFWIVYFILIAAGIAAAGAMGASDAFSSFSSGMSYGL